MQRKGEALHFGRWHCSGSETGSDRVLLTLVVLTNAIVTSSQNVFQGAGSSVRKGGEWKRLKIVLQLALSLL